MIYVTVKNLIPKSKNNGNESDYVYLDTLNDDDVGEFLAFEKKCTSNNSNNKLPELVEKIPTKGEHQCFFKSQICFFIVIFIFNFVSTSCLHILF